ERRRLSELRLGAVEALAEARLALGHHTQMAAWIEDLVAENPLRERLWAALMLTLYRSGRQAEALAAYRRLRETLVEGLGVEPSAALRDRHERILRQDDAAPPPLPVRVNSFVGRAAETEAVTRMLSEAGLVTLTGPAGSGKTRLAVELLASS